MNASVKNEQHVVFMGKEAHIFVQKIAQPVRYRQSRCQNVSRHVGLAVELRS